MPSTRRLVFFTACAVSSGALFFSLGAGFSQWRIEQQVATNHASIAELRDEMARTVLQARRERLGRPMGTDGSGTSDAVASDSHRQETLVAEIKRQLQSEMGLLPIRIVRERRKSFVEVNAYDKAGNMRYSTAGYLGNGHFITVKHGVMALNRTDEDPRVTAVKIRYAGKLLPATIVDSGTATNEVHPGDWAIIKVAAEIDLPALTVDPHYQYDFA